MDNAMIVEQLEKLSDQFRVALNNFDLIEEAMSDEAQDAFQPIRQAVMDLDTLISQISGKPHRDGA